MEVAFLCGKPAEHRKKFQEGRVPHVTRQSVPSGINHDPGTGFRARMPHRAEPGSCAKTAQAPEASGRADPDLASLMPHHMGGLFKNGSGVGFEIEAVHSGLTRQFRLNLGLDVDNDARGRPLGCPCSVGFHPSKYSDDFIDWGQKATVYATSGS